MPNDKDDASVPKWDGQARTWRRYTREVAWWVQSVPKHKRRYCATKLVSRLSGPARLLAMSWPLDFCNSPNGTRDLLRKLASSPLVRQSLPNTAAICQQYFQFRRLPGEQMSAFLIRETLGYAEFAEALCRLHEEHPGILQEHKDFGIPEGEDEDYDDSYWWGDWDWYADEAEPPAEGVTSPQTIAAASPGPGSAQSAPGSLRSGGNPFSRQAAQSAQRDDPPPGFEVIDELSLTDSFVMGVLRGWRLLQAACLSHEEKRDVLSTTHNKLDYDSISKALQSLWDEQLLGKTSTTTSYQIQMHETEDNSGGWREQCFNEEWSEDWQDDWHGDEFYDDHYDEGMDNNVQEELSNALDDEKYKEAHQAEKMAEQMAMEAQRTWAEAKKATAALHRDRGFGAVKGKGKSSNDNKCWICGGDHYARSCPDQRHPPHPRGPGKGKSSYMMDPYYDDYYQQTGGRPGFKGKKGKGKAAYVQDYVYEDYYAGKGKNSKGRVFPRGTPPIPQRSFVNSYYGLEMDLQHQQQCDFYPASFGATTEENEGMLDCGATASAGPEVAVRSLIKAVVAQDNATVVQIDQSARPYFRYGNGKWGRALFQVTLQSRASGELRQFRVFALPNPPELHQAWFDRSMLVPILIGMDHLGPKGACMMVDFTTGMALNTKEEDPSPFQLRRNFKGHYIFDVCKYLTGGNKNLEGHPHVFVCAASVHEFAWRDVYHVFPLQFDLTAAEVDQPVTACSEVDDHTWALMQRLRSASAQMLATAQSNQPQEPSFRAFLSNHGSSSSVFGSSGSHVLCDRGRGGNDSGHHQEGDSKEESTHGARSREDHAQRSSRPTDIGESVALLRNPPSRRSSLKSSRPVGPLRDLQPEVDIHPSEGITGE